MTHENNKPESDQSAGRQLPRYLQSSIAAVGLPEEGEVLIYLKPRKVLK
jgi:hypothetical protein